MPEYTSHGNLGAIATMGAPIVDEFPTSPNRNTWDSRQSVEDYSRRVGSSRAGTSSLTARTQRPGLVTGIVADDTPTAGSSSRINTSNNSIDLAWTSRIIGLQKWVGQIHSVENGLFTAELRPLDHDGPELFADFELRLLAPDEQQAQPGAIVYLTTRMIQVDSGRVEAVTYIRLRHPRRWSKTELDEVKRRGRDRASSFAKYARRTSTGG